MEEQLEDDLLFYDDACVVSVEVDYTTQSQRTISCTSFGRLGTVGKVSQGFGTDLKTVYIKRVKETHSMQVTNNVTTVDFFPEAFIAEADPIKGMIVTVKRFNKRVTFNANGLKSYSTVTALTARNEWETRIANGAEVTNYHTDKMPRSEYAPMACVG